MRQKIFCFVFVIVLAMGFKVPVSASFHTESRESVAVVVVYFDTDVLTELWGRGTGFFIGVQGEDPSYLITNYHVISSFINYMAGDLVQETLEDGTVLIGRFKIRVYYDETDYDEAYLVDSNEQKDVAILRLDNSTNKRKPLPLCSPTDSMVGSTVYAIGYPSLADNIVAGSTTSWGMSDCTITKGSISRLVTTEGTGVRNIQIDCDIRPGNSGGPLVNEDGAAVGINTWGYPENGDTLKYAINIDEAISMLKLHDVPYELINPLNPVVDEEPGDVGDDSDTDPVPSYGLYLAIGILAVIIVAAVAVILMRRKKKPEDVIAPPTPQPTRIPVVRTISGTPLRASLPPHGQLLIGRNPSDCNLVFPNNTPGVSGRHCSLSWDSPSASFVLTDLQSTYGTYLENGQKLAPGVSCHLRPGERFYLGEKKNMLSVGLE